MTRTRRASAALPLTDGVTPADATQEPAPQIEYSMSPGLVGLLARMRISVAFSSYQSGLFYMIGCNPKEGGAHLHQTALPKPMGIWYGQDGVLAVSTGFQIIRFENPLLPDQRVNEMFDACFVPRTIHVTGDVDAHDLAIDCEGRVVFVNTRFNCLATVSPKHSFAPLWRPPFISGLVDEDRCHLNGLAMHDGRPAYVSAVSRSDTIDGWRDRRGDGGVVIDVVTNRVVCDGLSMPHSPRLHNGRLWVANSGTGELGIVHLPQENGEEGRMGRFEPVVFCPGFIRGVAFHGKYAFVGLSKPRYKRFEGLALDQRLKDVDSEPWCGIQIIDLEKRTCVDWFRIDGEIGELYDVALIPDVVCPMAVSPATPEAMSFITSAPEDGPNEAGADSSSPSIATETPSADTSGPAEHVEKNAA